MEDALQRLGWRRSDVMEGIAARGALVKRRLNNGGIAGIVVGVCVAVGLVIFCLYPVVVNRIKRRRQRHAPSTFDPETGEVSRPGVPAEVDEGQRRLSSQDSFKPAGEITRGGLGEGSVKDLAWTPNHNLEYSQSQSQPQANHATRIDTSVAAPGAQPVQRGSESQSTPFADYNGEFMPQSIGDAHDGVLNGSSADYYSPSIPSEAFGMVTTRGTIVEPKQSLSRGSSLRHNMRHMFRRKSTRDQSLDSPSSPSYSEAQEAAFIQAALNTHDASLQRITTADRTESPVQVDPSATMPPPPAPQTLGSPVQLAVHSTPQDAIQTPPQSPPTEPKFKMSPSPPVHPAPGTINPMDIMPATTESELYHRTEYQLFMSSQSSPPMPEPADRDESPDAPSPFTLPQSTALHTPVVQSPTPTQKDMPLKQEIAEDDVAMTDIPSHNHLSPMPDYDARHPSYPSDLSTPLPGPASTNPSTLNTPATQLDSPSPKSEITSDYRHSASPSNGINNVSPKTGAYRCNEPGCSQVFDQPHKLKHHQRYHTKDHKCTYPGCGKGFGTKTHLQRHINDRHEKKKKFHCAIPGCDYSRQGGKGFPRKDNWKRHMTKIHGLDQQQLPEPVEADQDMGGM